MVIMRSDRVVALLNRSSRPAPTGRERGSTHSSRAFAVLTVHRQKLKRAANGQSSRQVRERDRLAQRHAQGPAPSRTITQAPPRPESRQSADTPTPIENRPAPRPAILAG